MNVTDGDDSLETALADYFERLDRGERVNEASVLSRYPQFAAELRNFFGDKKQLEHHIQQLGANSKSSHRLTIRCPHCNQPTEVAVDATLTDVKCSSCGSCFNLVQPGSASTRMPLTTLGRFTLVERLGVGSFGTVWKGRDSELDRFVAIKIPRHGGMSADDQEKFFREARAAAQLRHPNIVSIHEVGREGDSIYIVSDLVHGVTLSDWLAGQRPTGRECAEICATMADALDHAHARGIVHRDLKPANVMIDGDGSPHLMDFGLARREIGEVTLTIDGQVLGTPAYMSPEQAQGKSHEADRRSDIYSLGAILFQMLTSELPFRGNSRMILHQVIHEEAPSPRKFNPYVKRDLETITLKCLSKQPARRYATAAALADDLRRFLRNEPIVARPIGAIEKTWRWTQRRPAAAGLLGLLIASTIVSVWLTAKATRAERVAEERLHAGLLAAGDAALVSRKADARDSYSQAWDVAAQLGSSDHLATTGLLMSYEQQPPPLIGKDGKNGGAGGFDVSKPERLEILPMPNGKQLLSISASGEIVLWEIATGLPVRRIGPIAARCRAMSISPDGSQFIVAADNDLQLWNLDGAKPARTFVGHQQVVTAVDFSDDGEQIVSGGEDKTVRVWNKATGIQTHKFDAPSYVASVIFAPKGRKVLSGSEPDALVVWDLDSKGEALAMSDGTRSALIALAIAPDGRTALTGSLSAKITLWDLKTGKAIGDFPGHTAAVRQLCLSSDGRRVLSASADNTVRLWDVATAKELRVWTGHSAAVECCSFLADSRLMVTADQLGEIKLWDLQSDTEVALMRGHNERVVSVAASNDGLMMLSGAFDGTIRLWDVSTGLSLKTINTGTSNAWGVALASNNETAVSAHQDGTLTTWEVQTGRRLHTFTGHTNVATAAAFSGNDRMILSSSFDGTLRLWETDSGKVIRTFPGHVAEVRTVAISPDDRFGLSGSFDSTGKLWDLNKGTDRPLLGHTHRIHSVAFSADGKQIATGGWDNQCLIWDARSVTLSYKLYDSSAVITGVAFSADCKLLLTGSLDGELILWDLASRQPLRELLPPGSGITSVAFCGANQAAVAAFRDGYLKRWQFDRPKRYRSFTESLQRARDTLAHNPRDAEALATFAKWYAFRQVDDWAIGFFERAREAGGNVSSLDLARCYWRSSLPEKAALEFRKAIERREAPVAYLQLCLSAVETSQAPADNPTTAATSLSASAADAPSSP